MQNLGDETMCCLCTEWFSLPVLLITKSYWKVSSSPAAAGNKHCVQFIQCFSLSKRILKQDALEALAPPPQCSHSVGEQSGSSEAVGLCMLRVKYDLKSGLKFVQETRIFIAPDDEEIQGESDEQQQRGAGQRCLRLSWHRGWAVAQHHLQRRVTTAPGRHWQG